MKIIFTQTYNSWLAVLESDRNAVERGESEAEALGNLILNYREKFGVESDVLTEREYEEWEAKAKEATE